MYIVKIKNESKYPIKKGPVNSGSFFVFDDGGIIITIQKMLEVSTAHITYETAKWLDGQVEATKENNMELIVYEKGEYGSVYSTVSRNVCGQSTTRVISVHNWICNGERLFLDYA